MNLSSILICPQCSGELVASPDHWSCEVCQQIYPIIHGIHDFRCRPEPFEPNIEEAIQKFQQLTYQELLTLVLVTKRLPKRIDQKIKDYYCSENIRTEAMTAAFLQDAKVLNWGHVLDLGCGSGSALGSLKRNFKLTIGVDAHFGQLLLARKSLAEEINQGELHLICAHGESLPLKSACFDYIQSINVIEHLSDLPAVMSEVRRCLVDRGVFAGDSRNRYDIFAPEPHTGLRFLGFLPRALIPKFVNWRCDADYESTYLLSWCELKRSLRKVFAADEIEIHPPDIRAYGYQGRAAGLFNAIRNMMFIRELLLLFFVSHHVLITKKAALSQKDNQGVQDAEGA
ncbi:MAG: hypothetical protein BWX85_01006 [Chloroflexi bacterium ADurb.Bin120]|jgi:SAM-dependent methyltransferase|uniref:Methyltransferase type 11 domain-containing protein n=1 Tax=Candidatus Brevifilum fermentans TaxID=1986204 RepID=A0A1Y6K6M7_9CHLR|nr:MAG: hypothetical protein BWX85_01006 [Chloroflexi bacterium ADurb.Bin120]SMX55236.1 protein of unknown function [Brevefilum fermentans]